MTDFLFIFQNETPNHKIIEAVAHRSKVYALLLQNLTKAEYLGTNQKLSQSTECQNRSYEEIKKCKGVQMRIIKEKFNFHDFKSTLFDEHLTYVEFKTITSKNHKVSTNLCRKRALNPYDDKRYILPCLLLSFAYESIEIQTYNGQCNICSI